jgi:hypothetical protein
LKEAITQRQQYEKGLNDAYTNATTKGAQADLEMAKAQASGSLVPFDVKADVESLTTKKNAVALIQKQMDQVVSQLRDKNKTFEEKYTIAQRAAKLVNSAVGQDALTGEEADRALAQLAIMPSLGKQQIGPNIEAFANSLADNSKSIGLAIQSIESDIGLKLNKRPSTQRPSQQQNNPDTKKMSLEEKRKAVLEKRKLEGKK